MGALLRLVIIGLLLGFIPPAATPQAQAHSAAIAGPPAANAAAPAAAVRTARTSNYAPLPSIALGLAVAPDPIGVGETATISVTVENRTAIAATNLIITLPAPDGTLAQPGPGQVGPTQGWRWSLGTFAGSSTTTVTGTLWLVRTPASEAVLLHAQATAANITWPVEATAGAPAIDRSLGPATVPFNPGTAAQLRSSDGRVTVDIPAQAANRSLVFRHGTTPLAGGAIPAKPLPGGRRGVGTFFLDATDTQGNAVHQFDQLLTLSVAYTPEQLLARGLNEATLAIYWFDDQQDAWIALPTGVDAATHTAHAQVNHFSPYDLSDGSSPSATFVPSLQGFQFSTYTGAASYAIPIDLPAGPGGLKPSLSLNYSSAATDGSAGTRKDAQAEWVGKGWSLNAGGYVATNTNTGASGHSWDNYTLVFGGQSFDVVKGQLTNTAGCTTYSTATPIDCWTWQAVDENFARVRVDRDANNEYQWHAWTKDGTRYDFTQQLRQRQYDTNNLEIYKWLLTQVTDTHQNKITYTYHVDSVSDAGDTLMPTYYLQTITWGYDGTLPGTGAPRYKVDFIASPRDQVTADNSTPGVDVNYEYPGYPQANARWQSITPHEKYRLDRIQIRTSLDGVTYSDPPVSEYRLHYASTATEYLQTDYPGNSPGGQKVLTLTGVQRVGSDGLTALPETTFTYNLDELADGGTTLAPAAGWNRLHSINNGEGGQITFSYEHTWLPAEIPASDDYGRYYQNFYRVNQVLRQDTSGQFYSKSDLTTYGYTSSGTNTAALNDENHAATVVYAHYPPSSNGDSRQYLAHQEKREFRGHWYVVERHYDGTTADSTKLLQDIRHWFYQGNGGSANAVCAPARHLIGPGKYALDATELDPVNNPNSCFQQMFRNEAFKGREYRTEVNASSGKTLEQTLHAFVRTDEPFFGSDPDFFKEFNPATPANDPSKTNASGSNNYKRAGLWRAFVYESQTTDNAFEEGSLARPKTTKYFYNTSCQATPVDSYGNLGCIQELDTAGGLLRKTLRFYTIPSGGNPYIVDRMFEEATYDGSGFLVALTSQFYDGTAVANTAPTIGELKRVTRYYNIPPNITSTQGIQLLGSDTTYGYDAWGNRTTETLYTAGSTRDFNGTTITWGPVSGTARTTTTDYNDPGFHVFSTQVTDALGHVQTADYDYPMGTLIQVRGPNGTTAAGYCAQLNGAIPVTEETTCARYDVFGRMVTLIKPGDSTSAPTVQALYHDVDLPLTLPLRYEVKRRDTSADGIREMQQFYDGLGRQVQTKAESQDNAQNIVADMVYDGLGRVVTQTQPHYVPESGTAFTSYTPPQGGVLTNPTSTIYDGLGRVSTVTTPDGKQTAHFYQVWSDNGVPRVAHEVIDANHHRTRSSTDALDRLVKVEEYSGNCGQYGYSCATAPYTATWALYATTNYNYNATDTLKTATDAHGNATQLTYDSLGRKTQMIDPDMGTWTYSYDVNGNLLSQTDARGKRICFYYDNLNRLTGKHYQDNTTSCSASFSAASGDATYIYDQGTDGIGRRSAMGVIGGAGTSWSFDGRGRTSQATYTVPGLTGTRSFVWTYDSADRIQTLVYPTTTGVPAETVTYTYDAAGRPTSACSSLGSPACYASASQPYTALDQPQQWTFGNNAIQTWSYDSVMQRLAHIQVGISGSPGSMLDRSYDYDPVGNIAAITDTSGAQSTVQAFDYDHRDRLVHSGPAHNPFMGLSATLGQAATTSDHATAFSVGTTLTQPIDRGQFDRSQDMLPSIDGALDHDVGPASTSPAPESTVSSSTPSASTPATNPSAPAAPPRPDFSRLPLAFVPNRGQTDNPRVQFVAHGAGGVLFFTPDEMVLALPDPTETVSGTVVRLQYAGANQNPTLSGQNQLPGVVNYLIGNNAAKWQTNLPTYAGINYDSLYSGITLRYDGTDGVLKSTYAVAPGAAPAQIRWRYQGATDVQVNAVTGDLSIQLPPRGGRVGRTLTEHAPRAWQDIAGQRIAVSASFVVDSNKTVGFALGSYDTTQALTIDPVLTYSTYHGGTSTDKANGIAVDSSGNAYITGYTSSSSTFPLQSALDSSYNGNTDAFISKLNASGSALVYSTYLGGSGEDKGNAIALDASGNVVVAGETQSSNFPTHNAFDSSYGGGTCSGAPCEDVFVTKLNAAGSALLYSTYLGGSGNDEGEGVALDSSGNVDVTGATAGGLTTKNAYDSSYNGGVTDAFLTKLNPAASGSSSHLYTTYLGGSGDEQGNAIAVDSSGKAYIAGETYSSGFPTKNAYDSSQNGQSDVFVSKLDPATSGTSSLLYSTFLGGTSFDKGLGITVDSAGNAYVTGYAQSTNFPVQGAWQTSNAGDKDAILVKVNTGASGTASLPYSTYIGGTNEDRGLAIARDSTGALYLTGFTNSITYPVTLAVQDIFGGGTCGTISCTDTFVTAFDLTQNAPIYSTFLGGTDNDEGHGIAVDASGAAYVAGFTASSNFPTASPRQGTSGGGSDAFVAKLSQPTVQLSAATLSVGEAAGSAALNVTLSSSSPVTVTVNYATGDGTANAGNDYTAQSGTLTFAPGVISQSISVPISNDNIDEPNETFTLSLSAAVGARLGTPASTTVTSTDDDPLPTVSWQAANVSVNEAAGSALVSAVLSNPAAATITVQYATSNGTATAGSDYTSTSGSFTFAPGVTSQSASVPILDDATTESNETINLTLSSPTNATLGTPNPATLTIVDDETPQPPSDEVYTYDKIGNLLSKTGVGTYSYPATSSAHPHAVSSTTSGTSTITYTYDLNGNMTGRGGLLTTWDHENRPLTISTLSGSESYSYDADGERVQVVAGSTTTVYLGGLWEETSSGAVKAYYSFNGQTIAVRDSTDPTDPVSYLHGDHLGSVSVASGAGASTKGSQRFDPWGKAITGGITQTRKNYTGQYLDTTGLLYYHARYYDPTLARFLSADSVVPGSASGGMDGIALKGLTVDFHEPGFATQIGGENSQSFWFQMSDQQRQKAGSPWGPGNPQALNRYSYVLNGPVRYTDPKGHETYSWGITFRGGGVLGGSISFGITTDDKGGLGFYFSRSGGATVGAILGASIGYSETGLESIVATQGSGKQVGADVLLIGGDAIFTDDKEIIGGGGSIGIGMGMDIHVEKTYTDVLTIIPTGSGNPINPCPNGPGRCSDAPLPAPAGTPIPAKPIKPTGR